MGLTVNLTIDCCDLRNFSHPFGRSHLIPHQTLTLRTLDDAAVAPRPGRRQEIPVAVLVEDQLRVAGFVRFDVPGGAHDHHALLAISAANLQRQAEQSES